ncbi:hypothetical protein QV06_01675 [Gallibacterium genomosp. 3]|uniref:Fimbrial-type adhesion domain-containing protein n=2 Tax=Gallibacterium genomosp. 3 TaxID=505345 RepID=A0A1A7PUZ7_9PAST|nr:hypothetical protein QV06_01675 [Gallibacterium genomosp. 3]
MVLMVGLAKADSEYRIPSKRNSISLTIPGGIHEVAKARDNWSPLPAIRGNGVNQDGSFFGRHESPAQRPTSIIEAKVILEPTGYIYNGLPIFKIPGNDYVGIVLYVGDTRAEKGVNFTNKNWQEVFKFGGNSSGYQGLNLFFRSVMYASPQERIPGQQIEPALTSRLLVGYIRSRAIYANVGKNGIRNGVTADIPIYLEPYGMKYTISTCTMTSPQNITVQMPKISKSSLDNAPVNRGLPEVYAGIFELKLNQCGAYTRNEKFLRNDISRVLITFTDATDPSNTGSYLKLTPDSMARGVGIRIYPVDGPFWQYQGWWVGLNSLKGLNYDANNRNVLQRFIVKYAKTGDITPGTVNATATFTFSYQ